MICRNKFLETLHREANERAPIDRSIYRPVRYDDVFGRNLINDRFQV